MDLSPCWSKRRLPQLDRASAKGYVGISGVILTVCTSALLTKCGDPAHQCQLRSTTAFSEELWITVNPVRGVCWFFILLHFPEGESQVLTWIRHCRFCGKRYLARSLGREYRGRLPNQQLTQWQHDDNTSAFGVRVSEGGVRLWEQTPWSGVGDPEVFELSAFDTQNQESRAKLPLKRSFWGVHCRCNWASLVKSFIRAKLVSATYLWGGIF